ncbi:MazG nucleotide pyrophosphohydrolase domain-containing protein [Planococcus sp. N064]|uniref:MazG nucleotide pyrophosphohydrolase domain-containing protein n=1 Tax=Planococcus liqunii TaxID=3058394 RepID=A0ABT8MU81_9BACL|nr:MazG nucleotide pyrophosphohydrolase domain-containing protein [Planococcus sp. N064]MDN7228467.1 MazG nucleotide pyrophosphohydrolase domain-containing protein [Planococcus sp. N064]
MKEAQAFAKQYQKEMGWSIEDGDYEKNRASLLNNYMLLTTEVAEIAEELRKAFNLTYKYVQSGMEEEEAFRLAAETVKEDIGKEMADCLAYIMKFANFFDIDLEESFYGKMEEVKNRQNKDASAKTTS